MDFDRYSRFRFRRDGRILHAAIAAPGPVNAVDAALHAELATVFADLQHDECDLVVLTGAGRAFCAGGDFDWFAEQIADPERFRAIGFEAKRIVGSLLELEKPIICRLNGAAAGLGATIALLCDCIVAAEEARIGDPHVKVGLVAGDGGAVIWPALVGMARAKEFLLTGRMLSAAEAAAIGLVNRAVPAAELDSAVAALAGEILANPRHAVRWTKLVMNQPLRQLAIQSMDASIAYETLSNMTADRAEAVASLRERRPPRFTGD